VQVHYDEGVANHIGPESCVRRRREARHEALTGECVGQQWSHDRVAIPGADAVQVAEGKMEGRANASALTTRRGRRPWHAWTLLVREPGDLSSDQSQSRTGPRREGEEP
jgi:hypothetical protein